jgi:hypothetical protein
MPGAAFLIGRFPQHELSIHRLYASSADFRAICEDYEEALRALRYWQAACGDADAKVLEYREFVKELETEILQLLEAAQKCGHRDEGD